MTHQNELMTGAPEQPGTRYEEIRNKVTRCSAITMLMCSSDHMLFQLLRRTLLPIDISNISVDAVVSARLARIKYAHKCGLIAPSVFDQGSQIVDRRRIASSSDAGTTFHQLLYHRLYHYLGP